METNTETCIEETRPIIEYIVISGGSLSSWGNIGILHKSHSDGFWNIRNIKRMYGTSMGSILTTFISLLNTTPYTQNYIYNWEMLEDYFVKRPWHTVFKMDLSTIMGSFQNRGIFTISLIQDVFAPIFNAMDISMDITMAELYDIVQIELHFYTVELAEFKLIDISYKTHPDWKVLESIYCSACIPPLFAPHKRGDSYYIDGGFLLNYPLRPCIDHILQESSTQKVGIFGISRKERSNIESIDDQSSLLDYMNCIFNKIMQRLMIHTQKNEEVIPESIYLYETHLQSDFFSLYKIFEIAGSVETRADLLEYGKRTWADSIPLDLLI